ncbi:DCC1-like thiol-disulfide oxidoreductase family protein [Sphingomonas sp. ABOLE]|uniref:DCC1-like thiol-disulfide oxidoreductase family protein n=1 Tax=Sphingomonas sp. ABOLE TaxID=1985878 RepID=UPI000F7EEA65|nr:DCC1-like thiol-disulfide oxidoreductase family protein [Sphingomonas sp. ABOLE]
MNDASQCETLVLLYDGECPFCTHYCAMAALAARGIAVELHDAREAANRTRFPAASRYDLDRGMLALWRGKAFHGADAMNLVGILIEESPWSGLMQHRWLASFCYPALRLVRNAALAVRRGPRIGGR